ncbi:hypothetical protein BH23GEM6_BH23GEM6_10480 [soil metagenome]
MSMETVSDSQISDHGTASCPLGWNEAAAVRWFIDSVRGEVDADLVQASLFGSRARNEARPDSDIDILLVFRQLAEDREPQASHAEWLADRIAFRTGIPVTTWVVSLVDLVCGNRTPMLVDALADSVPLWWEGAQLPRLPFTPEDGLWCAERLLCRVEEGGYEVGHHLHHRDAPEAARRIRDDVVRLSTALLLLRGTTRPRRAGAAATARTLYRWPAFIERVLSWASSSYGRDGRDEDASVVPPPGGLRKGARAVAYLRDQVEHDMTRLERSAVLYGTSRGRRA